MKSRSVRMLAIALCIVFLSMIFSSAVQSSFGKVEVLDLLTMPAMKSAFNCTSRNLLLPKTRRLL